MTYIAHRRSDGRRTVFLWFDDYCDAINRGDYTESELSVDKPHDEAFFLRGVNLAGGEFGPSRFPLIYGQDYIYPGEENIGYYAWRGMNTIRVPFKWENIQRDVYAPLYEDEVDRLLNVVEISADNRLFVVIDLHNHGRYAGKVIGEDINIDAFADIWQRLANCFKDHPNVIFDIMNEPYDMPTLTIFDMAQTAINVIRDTGARNLILVEGNCWSGGSQWLGNGNGILSSLVDPLGRTMLSPHQYLDADASGIYPECVSPTIGVERLTSITQWARAEKQRLILGEFGAGANATCEAAVKAMINYIETNHDVWRGWLWWAGGPWWGEYFPNLEPKHSKQISWLSPYLRHR